MVDIDKINVTKQYDRRIKLSDKDKKIIYKTYWQGGTSYNQLAKQYHVSKRLIIFICNPEKYEKVKEQHKERRKDGRYKETAEQKKQIMREHRAYKRHLYDAGLINK